MRKTDKKRNNAIRKALTQACESALDSVEGFQWLTHKVNYQNFPDSLVVICVFSTDQHLEDSQALSQLHTLVVGVLKDIDIRLPQPDKQIQWDSEQACEREQGGNWSRRLAGH
ncbi:hypothetical protein HMF8227_02626 [Saliniradius amylolyticus]|uniref:Fis family transcriptional regulator n=1 Tax=Saliniradius amylolyticus TaxID=2183582 RepID=A0A2S2E602_9ALTE|nr:Fis family transcriptional regulator [Saliniradius amylolyticus]AWL13078.1 hypothetical protein HMF8227_02626 [Saliniradius amylolyticus]